MTGDPDATPRPPRVFVSYSHDDPEHLLRILTLANELREGGIDVVLDQYEQFPPQGWPQWMLQEIHEADFVLCVASETYNNRVSGRVDRGTGKGAKWEGAIITQALFEGEGHNEKFVPVFFGAAAGQHIPAFLRQFTHFDMLEEPRREALYRLLTDQPSVVKPPLGALRTLPPATTTPDGTVFGPLRDFTDLALVLSPTSGLQFVAITSLVRGSTTEIVAKPLSSEGGDFLSGLRGSGEVFAIAFGNLAFRGRTQNLEERWEQGVQAFHWSVVEEVSDYGAGIMEMNVQDLSADEIADLRARRILLNEPLATQVPGKTGGMHDAMYEVAVRGIGTFLPVEESPIPTVFEEIGDDREFFIAGVRLVCILWLRLSGTVERILELDISREGNELVINFRGRRHKVFSNKAATEIRVSGRCKLQ